MSPHHCIPIVWYFGKSEFSFQEKVWRYQRGNHKSEIEGQRTDNAMTKIQKNKMTPSGSQITTRNNIMSPLKTRDEIRWSGMVSNSCSTIDTRRVTRDKNGDVLWTRNKYSMTYCDSMWKQFCTGFYCLFLSQLPLRGDSFSAVFF